MLRITTARVLQLIHEGHLRPHPVLADRIPRAQIERFALQYDHTDAETDVEERRTLDAPATAQWDTPPMHLR